MKSTRLLQYREINQGQFVSAWNDADLRSLFLNRTPFIDVRAPIEFSEGIIPGSVNIPILTDSERHQIGTTYRQEGQAAAIDLGHWLVSGEVKKLRVDSWIRFLKDHPEARVFCFRGGLRSQIACSWINEQGLNQTPIAGGYKRLRRFLLSILNEGQYPTIVRLGGLTGSGKTTLIQQLKNYADLEKFANHRGSIFGSQGLQPSQVTFENEIAHSLIQNPTNLIVEDESINLGSLVIPLRFFRAMNASPLVILVASLEERIKNVFEDYVLQRDEAFFVSCTQRMQKKLGGLRTQMLVGEIKRAFSKGKLLEDHSEWIALFLSDYYDPFYEKALARQSHLILFKGNRQEISDWWNSRGDRITPV